MVHCWSKEGLMLVPLHILFCSINLRLGCGRGLGSGGNRECLGCCCQHVVGRLYVCRLGSAPCAVVVGGGIDLRRGVRLRR